MQAPQNCYHTKTTLTIAAYFQQIETVSVEFTFKISCCHIATSIGLNPLKQYLADYHWLVAGFATGQ
jgi:hypothetical protein